MAKIEKKEIGFPMGETVKVIVSNAKVEIKPVPDSSGNPTEKGEIVISFKYEEATVASSGPTKPLERMFSICNQKAKGEIFNKINDISLTFNTNAKKATSPEPENAPKEMTIVITGEGPKKNSLNIIPAAVPRKKAAKKKK